MYLPHSTASRIAVAACLLTVTLSACQKSGSDVNANNSGQPVTAAPIAALPLATAALTTPATDAPVATALPSGAGRIRFGIRHGRERYDYTDRAYAMGRAFGDTPPDYTVDYEGTRPWVWRSNDGGYRVVERLADGQRTYYYARGADRPFYITDSLGGYAYDGATLVGIYGPDGAPLSDSYAQRRAGNAARYYNRSAAIYHAAQYSQRQAAYAADWRARRDHLAQQQQAWDEARNRDAEWASWHAQHQQDEDRRWQGEQDRRAAYAVAIGAAILGTAAVVSGNHADGSHYDNGQNRAAPPTAPRPNDATRPAPPPPAALPPASQPYGAGYGQHQNGNAPDAGHAPAAGNTNAPRVGVRPPPAIQHPAGQPVAPQSLQGGGGIRPQNQLPHPPVAVMPQGPLHGPIPARQNPTMRAPSAPVVVLPMRAPAVMQPLAPVPPVHKQPPAGPRPTAAITPPQPTAVSRPAFEGPMANPRRGDGGGAGFSPHSPARPADMLRQMPHPAAPVTVSISPSRPNIVVPVQRAQSAPPAPPAASTAAKQTPPRRGAGPGNRPHALPTTAITPPN